MKKTLITLVLTAALAASPMAVFAAPKKMADGGLFDAQYYAATYPDVKAAFGTDENLLYNHYKTYGKNEGRLPYNPADAGTVQQTSVASHQPKVMPDGGIFDPQFYADMYADVKAAFGTNETLLYNHYKNYGIKEGRLPYDPKDAAVAQQLAAAQAAKPKSYNTNQLVTPSQAFVEQGLATIPGVTGVQSVTETHDPNGKLNKTRGYISSTYFTYSGVDQSRIYGDDIVEKGNDGGGDVEVYRNASDANARNTYLSFFDGAGALSPGSHVVVGTCVIRTSDELTATQQNTLTQQIINALSVVQ